MSSNTARKHDVRKQSVYLSAEVLEAVKAEAKHQDRSISWIVNRAWALAHAQIKAMAGIEPVE